MARPKGSGGEKVNKMALVRAAIPELGGDPSPQELHDHILATHGVDIPNNVLSNYKSVIKSKGAGGGTGRRGRRAGGGGIQVADLEAVRGLVDRLGADQVKQLVDVLK